MPGGRVRLHVPVLLDGAEVHRTGDERTKCRPRCQVTHGIEAALAKVADAGCEAEAEQVAQAEDVIDGAGGIGRMFADRDAAFMVE